ncbi:MAG TPA: MFS transporter [Nocardioides sp.]
MPLAPRRWALFALFFLPGLGIASWVTRTPAIRDELGATTGEMGLVLFGLTLGLFLFGAGMGGGEVAMNVEGADVEELTGRPFLPALHGCFSLGTVVGASLGIGFTATDVAVGLHLTAVGVVAAAALAVAIRHLPADTGRAPRRTAAAGAAPRRRLPLDRPLLLIGVVVLAMALAEGTANDWLPLVMVDGHGLDPALGSVVYTVFAAAMTVGRFAGGPVVARLGNARVLAASAGLGVAGIVLASLVDHQGAAATAVVLWGLGTSLGFPVAISAAGESGPDSAARVSLAATAGYVAFLVGPPVLGFVGDHEGLRAALLIPAAVLAVGMLAALLVPSREADVRGQDEEREPIAASRRDGGRKS